MVFNWKNRVKKDATDVGKISNILVLKYQKPKTLRPIETILDWGEFLFAFLPQNKFKTKAPPKKQWKI